MFQIIQTRPRNPGGRIPVRPEWYKIDTSNLSGKTIAELEIRRLTGCTVVAINRDGKFAQFPDLDLPLLQGDEILVAGTSAQLAFFKRAFGLSAIDPPQRPEKRVA